MRRSIITASRPPVPMPAGIKGVDADPEQLSEIIGGIYQGVMEPEPWQASLRSMLGLLDAQHVTLILRSPTAQTTGVMVNTNTVSTQATEAYNTHFFALDPFVHLPENTVVTADELLGAEWLNSALYCDFLRPLDVRHVLGTDLRTDSGVHCRFRVVRSHGADAFNARDTRICRLLMPHLRRAVQLHAQLDHLNIQRELFAGTMNRMRLGVISLAADGSIREINDEAQRILAEHDGIERAGRALSVARQSESRELQRLIHKAIEAGHAGQGPGMVDAMSITRPSGRSRFGIVVRSLPTSHQPEGLLRPAAVLMLRDPEQSGLPDSRDMVQRLFGLTRSEADLALCLAEGCTLDEAAEKMHVTRNTARTYLRFIFSKTGVTRQAMLVRMLLGSVASLGADAPRAH
jgi:DNA-binding CsgD family transcriptional regulator/PAS domain-containing protein